MVKLVYRKKEAVTGAGAILSGTGALLFKFLPDPYAIWIGGVIGSVGLGLIGYGTFGITIPERIFNEWQSERLYRALGKAPANSTITIIQTSIPDATKLIGVLEQLLTQKDKQFRLRLLLLDYEDKQASALIAARMQHRPEQIVQHTREIRENIEQFIKLKGHVDEKWKESRSSAYLDLEIRLYTFLPFGSVFQIGDECFISGLYWNHTSSINGPMLVITDKNSTMWNCFQKQVSKGWGNAREVYPSTSPVNTVEGKNSDQK